MAKDAKDDRTSKIDELVAQLDPQVPRLTIHVPDGADTSSVTVDNARVESFGEPILLDPGPHTIEYATASGHKKSKVVPLERGGSSEINLDVPTKQATGDHTTTTKPPPPPTHVDEVA